MLFLHPRLHHYQRSRFASLFLTVLPTVCFVVLFLGWCVTGLFQTYRLLYYSRTESAINIERLYITTNHLMDFLAPQRFLLLTRYNIFLGIATIVANSAQNEQAMQMLIHLLSACWWHCPQASIEQLHSGAGCASLAGRLVRTSGPVERKKIISVLPD